jgi:arabinose-5-phosphate isomerase
VRSFPRFFHGSSPLTQPPPTNEPGIEASLASLDAVVSALSSLRARATSAEYVRAADVLASAERCHACGVGKSGHVARYAASLLSATGTPCSALDPYDALHGSVGQVARGDAVLAISHSGATPELLSCVAAARSRGARIVSILGDASSPLARASDCVLDASAAQEGGPLGLAPRASAAVQLAVAAALSAELQHRAGQTSSDFAELHPAGALGERARKGSEPA